MATQIRSGIFQQAYDPKNMACIPTSPSYRTRDKKTTRMRESRAAPNFFGDTDRLTAMRSILSYKHLLTKHQTPEHGALLQDQQSKETLTINTSFFNSFQYPIHHPLPSNRQQGLDLTVLFLSLLHSWSSSFLVGCERRMGFNERIEIGSVSAQHYCSELGRRKRGEIDGEEIAHLERRG